MKNMVKKIYIHLFIHGELITQETRILFFRIENSTFFMGKEIKKHITGTYHSDYGLLTRVLPTVWM